MLRQAVFAVFSVAITLPGVALAAGDPTILIDAGDPDPFLLSQGLGPVQPNGQDPLTFDFLNDTGGVVTSFTFTTQVNPNLTTASTSFTFTPSSFFASGSVDYTPTDGTLVFKFFGTNSINQGIPTNFGFHITLQGWVTNACSGGGSATPSTPCGGTPGPAAPVVDEQLYSGLPTFQSTFTTTPEPAAWMLLGTAIIGVGVAFRRRSGAAR